VVGVDPATVDELWSAGTADSIIVEADGSRGRSLKTFAAHEPRLPSATTTAVLVAGLDVVGEPLTDVHVHRADAFAATLGCVPGSELTPSVVADALRDQTAAVRRLSASRVVVLLNKLDVRDGDTVARRIAAALMPRTDGNDGAEDADRRDTPDGLVVASLAERRYNAVEAARG
jgi:probable selenium-dependent hydroxylase accessory protein YqeC